jgi:hypothetical protein
LMCLLFVEWNFGVLNELKFSSIWRVCHYVSLPFCEFANSYVCHYLIGIIGVFAI